MTTQRINIGRVRPVYRGAWNAAEMYSYLNFVSHNRQIWQMVGADYAVGDEPVENGETGISLSGRWLLAGAKGADGTNGADGAKGEKGEQGIQGPAGIQGPQGEKGEKGDKGDTGEQGIQGPQGIQGATGSTPAHRWNGTKLQFDNPDGTPGELVDLQGPQGVQGEQGPIGPQGETGPEGPTGPAGPQGPKGDKGDTTVINAFSNVSVGGTTLSADSPADTLTLAAGTGITLTPNAESDTVTVALGSHTHDYLPLAGGTMTGSIVFSGVDNFLTSQNTNRWNRILSGPTINDGARLSLAGKDQPENPGQFWLAAKNSTSQAILIGSPDGTLRWKDSIVVTESQGTAQIATKLIGVGAGVDEAHHIKFDWGRQSEGYLGVTVDKTDIGLLLTDKNYLNHTVCRPTDTGLTTGSGASFTTPAGGTWLVLAYNPSIGGKIWIKAGGTTLTIDGSVGKATWWAWRIS